METDPQTLKKSDLGPIACRLGTGECPDPNVEPDGRAHARQLIDARRRKTGSFDATHL